MLGNETEAMIAHRRTCSTRGTRRAWRASDRGRGHLRQGDRLIPWHDQSITLSIQVCLCAHDTIQFNYSQLLQPEVQQ